MPNKAIQWCLIVVKTNHGFMMAKGQLYNKTERESHSGQGIINSTCSLQLLWCPSLFCYRSGPLCIISADPEPKGPAQQVS